MGQILQLTGSLLLANADEPDSSSDDDHHVKTLEQRKREESEKGAKRAEKNKQLVARRDAGFKKLMEGSQSGNTSR